MYPWWNGYIKKRNFCRKKDVTLKFSGKCNYMCPITMKKEKQLSVLCLFKDGKWIWDLVCESGKVWLRLFCCALITIETGPHLPRTLSFPPLIQVTVILPTCSRTNLIKPNYKTHCPGRGSTSPSYTPFSFSSFYLFTDAKTVRYNENVNRKKKKRKKFRSYSSLWNSSLRWLQKVGSTSAG